LFIAVIFASVLLHELAHAVTARRCGLLVLRIDIHALGGLVLFWYLPLKRSQDFAITLAGPMANLAIALVTLVLLASVPLEPTTIEIDGRIFIVLGTEKGFLEQLLRGSAYLNLGLCAVNLIPAFPLDGGKLVYLVIDKRWGSRVAALIVRTGYGVRRRQHVGVFCQHAGWLPDLGAAGIRHQLARVPICASWERRLEQERR
jgi:Zn-dependent protease